MSEQIGVVFLLVGLLAATVGLVWTVVRAAGFALRWRSGRHLLAPLTLLAAGLVVGAAPFAYQHVYLAIVGLGERERVIDGERALNLTGWDREGYGILAAKRDVAILEMGNPDVTDATVAALLEMPLLRELTLNDSAVSDAGLETLARLPKLESLRIARTKVTPDGVARFLDAPPPRLRQIDVSGLGVPASVLRRWKNAADKDSGEERRYVN
jgi:hypothetical protein